VPFKSEAQRKWMHANHPGMARRWEAHTPEGALPARVTHGAQSRQPKGQGGGGQWAGYVASPLLRHRDRR
jgi:hypothetical protein